VISVGVGIDNRYNRPLTELFIDEFQRSPRGLCGSEGVEDDPARGTLYEADVGKVEPAIFSIA
jgi:hypothetical protein